MPIFHTSDLFFVLQWSDIPLGAEVELQGFSLGMDETRKRSTCVKSSCFHQEVVVFGESFKIYDESFQIYIYNNDGGRLGGVGSVEKANMKRYSVSFFFFGRGSINSTSRAQGGRSTSMSWQL